MSRGTHPRCPVVASPAPGVFVDSRRESKNRMGIPPPPVFLQKSAQTVENKGSECEKESKEKPRGGKLLKRWSLAKQRRKSAVECGAAVKTRLLEATTRGQTGIR